MGAEAVVAVEVHYHHAWLIWSLFFVGLALHALLQITKISKDQQKKRMEVLEAVWPVVAYRWGVCAFLFGLLWQYPEILVKLVGLIGLHPSADESSVFALPMNNILALGYGLAADSLIGYVPILQSNLPPVADVQTVEVTHTTTEKTEVKKTPPAPAAPDDKKGGTI